MNASQTAMRHAALVSAPERIYLRLFAEAPAARSAELASSLVRCLVRYGDVHVREGGIYWKIPQYLEFNVDLTGVDSAASCAAHLRALQPAGWSGHVWNHQLGGPRFLLPEIRWAWLTTGDE